ncbi:hypothetical protein GCM10009790_25290 [Georgenia ruanii]
MPPAIGIAVLAVALAVAFLPGKAPASAGGRPASVPARLADYSYLTGDVSASPPGRAVALYQHGFGVEFMDFPQAVMLGADGDVYRRVGVAEARGGPETQGDAAPMLLSPDGTRIAVGDYASSAPDVAVLDPTSGRVKVHPVPGGRSAIPLAWSPDSTLLAYLTTAEPSNPYTGTAITGDVGVLDARAGTASILPGPPDVRAVAFSPDGTQMAIHRIEPDGTAEDWGIPRLGGGTVDIVALDGTVRRQIELPSDRYLSGPAAWSPDGTLLATRRQSTECDDQINGWDEVPWQRCLDQQDDTVFVDVAGGGDAVPPALPTGLVGSHGLLGWTDTDEVIVLDNYPTPGDPEADTALYWLTAVPLDGGEPRRLSAVPGGGNYGVGNFQLATALLPDLQVREAGEVDRGRWPAWLRLGTAALSACVALLATRIIIRRTERPAVPRGPR